MGEAKRYLDKAVRRSVPALRTEPPGGRQPAADNPADPLVGRLFNNRFRIHSLLACGGMGKVYRAVQVPLGRVVALKVLHPALTATQNSDFHRRFFLEASIAAQLTHPSAVTVFDFGQSADGIYYLAMEYLQGMSLRQALQQVSFFSAHRALSIAQQVALALREAHALGAIHRDLKPANIFLLVRNGVEDVVKVLDFGLVKSVVANDDVSRITQPGRFMGSPGYMAPEQIRGRPLDARCDIYAIGVVLYEMLVGRPPFCRRNAFETMSAHVHESVLPCAAAQPHNPIPPQLDQLVQKCLQKRAADRYGSVDALLGAMAALLGGESPVTLVGNAPQQPLHRLPARLDDEERSGWSVACSRGLLASHRIDQPALAAFGRLGRSGAPTAAQATDDVPTVLGQTLAMEGSALAGLRPVATEHQGSRLQERRRCRPAWLLTGLLGLLLIGQAWPFGPQGARLKAWAWPPTTLRVELRSTPPGAQAWLQDRLLCAQTPCAVDLPAAHRPKNFVVRFKKAGYAEYVTSRRPRDGLLRVEAHLDEPSLPPLEQLPRAP